MRNKEQHINFPAYEIIIAYLENKLSAEDRVAFEKNMADDVFVAEAVEGLRGLPINEIKERLKKINTDIDVLTKVKKPKIITLQSYQYAVAASLIILIAAAWLFTNNMKETTHQVSQNTKPEMINDNDTNSPPPPKEMATDSNLDYIEKKSSNATVVRDNVKTLQIEEEPGLFIVKDETTIPRDKPPAQYNDKDDLNKTELGREESETDDESIEDDDLTHQERVVQATTTENLAGSGKETTKTSKAENKEVPAPASTSADDYLYEEGVIYQIVDEMPEFPGGEKKLFEFLIKNLKYPQAARENNIEGKVYVKFIVNENGKLADPEVIKGIGYGCDEEVIRIISKMPDWKPGLLNKKPVRVYYTLPVIFTLQ